MSIISKELERPIYEKLCNFLSISDTGRCTTGAILSAVNDWHCHLDRVAEVQTVFFDFQKAFDTVPHAKLISKLTALSVSPHLVSWISSYLYSRKQQVVVYVDAWSC